MKRRITLMILLALGGAALASAQGFFNLPATYELGRIVLHLDQVQMQQDFSQWRAQAGMFALRAAVDTEHARALERLALALDELKRDDPQEFQVLAVRYGIEVRP